MKKLFLLRTKGLGKFYVVSSSVDAAINRLSDDFKKANWGLEKDREIIYIEVLANQIYIL